MSAATRRDWLGGPRPPHAMRTVARVVPAGVPGLREGLQAVMRRIFGAGSRRRDDDHGRRDATGLCGPGSASWQVLAEPGAIAGGIRALLLQALHPLAMAGVADHSTYRADPLGRLRRTSLYVTTSTFGALDDALEVARRVRETHRSVAGTAPDGRAYAAGQPHLLVWVSVALTSSFLAADRLWAPDPVTGDRADAFVAEQSRIAALLDPRIDPGAFRDDPAAREQLRRGEVDLPLLAELPGSVTALVETLDAFDDELSTGPRARAAVRFLRWPPLSAPLRIGYLSLFAGAAGSLPPTARHRLGLPAGRLAGIAGVAQTAAALTVLRGAAGPSPAYRAATARLTAAA